MIRQNVLKKKLDQNKIVLGPFVRINSSTTVEIIGYAGFDFCILDMEHGPLDFENVENLIRTATLSGCTPVVRVSENSESLILRALDAGAQGVQIPQITNKESAVKAVNSCYFYPRGNRGVCRFTRSAQYSHIPRNLYFSNANNEVLVILMIEGKEGIEKLEEILEVEGIDVIFIGPYDLSQSLGVPGQVESKIVKDAMRKAIEIAARKNVVVGTFADTLELAKEWMKLGVQYISYSIDTGIFYEYSKKLVEELRQQ